MIKKAVMIIAMLGVVGFIHAEIPYWIEDTGNNEFNLW